MILFPILDQNEIQTAFTKYKEIVSKGLPQIIKTIKVNRSPKPNLVNPNIGKNVPVFYSKEERCWFFFDGKSISDRYWCPVGIMNIMGDDPLETGCETNILFSGANCKIGAMFAKDDGGNIYLLHSGNAKGFLKEQFLDCFSPEHIADIEWGKGKTSRAIILGNISDGSVRQKVADFVRKKIDCAVSNRDMDKKPAKPKRLLVAKKEVLPNSIPKLENPKPNNPRYADENQIAEIDKLNQLLKEGEELGGVFLPKGFKKRSDIMMVAEMPSMNEPSEKDKNRNYNFDVTARDKFFQEMLVKTGLGGVYVTDIVKRRNYARKPTSDEVISWRPFLLKEISILRPKMIIVIGQRTYLRSFQPFIAPMLPKNIPYNYIFHYGMRVNKDDFATSIKSIVKKYNLSKLS
jgi:hypothetical protein